jgi:hypothetical protein
MSEFDASVGGGKPPVHHRRRLVTRLLPGGNLSAQGVGVRDATVQALTGENV